MAKANDMDPVELAQRLIRCPSVTPEDAGALDVLQTALEELGFTCHRLPFSEGGTPDVENLYARIGGQGPNFCFAGHTDVVPVGATDAWTIDPFAGDVIDGVLYGRGAADMKSSIAAFVTAASRLLQSGTVPGSISFLITGDEEGPAINGTRKVLQWMKKSGEVIDHCLVGEPTNPRELGEMAKIGRRGSLNAEITIMGAQGHVAYPHLADNPIPRLVKLLDRLTSKKLDDGTAHFQPSNLEITNLDVGNSATNVIPAAAKARLNIRFNDEHTGRSLEQWLRAECVETGGQFSLEASVSGEAFLTPPGLLSELVTNAVHKVTGTMPELSTTGGTSDARFIKDHCPVIEFGLVGQTMHKVDERVMISDIHAITDIYEDILINYFNQ